MATHSSILAWKIPWTEGPGGLQSMGSHRVDTTARAGTHTSTQRSPWPQMRHWSRFSLSCMIQPQSHSQLSGNTGGTYLCSVLLRAVMGKEEGTLRGVGLFCVSLFCDSKTALLPSKEQGTGLVEVPQSQGSSRIFPGLGGTDPTRTPFFIQGSQDKCTCWL